MRLKIALSNTCPDSAQKLSDIVEIPPGNGYETGGKEVTDGVVTFTASGGEIGPFNFAIFYIPEDELLVAWKQCTQLGLKLGLGETFTIDLRPS